MSWIKRTVQHIWQRERRTGSTCISHTPFAGVNVNEDKALTLSSVWCCVNQIASLVAGLPLIMYVRNADGTRERAEGNPTYKLLKDSPNHEVTKFDFWQSCMVDALLWGNSVAEIERDNMGNPLALWKIPPQCLTLKRVDGFLIYEAGTGQEKVSLPASDVIHIKGLGDGVWGKSPIQIARESMSMTLATERYGQSFFANACRPSGVIKVNGEMSEQGMNNLKKSWRDSYSGEGNTSNIAVLEEGIEYMPMSIPNEEAQFLQTRQFQLSEICRWFNLSPVFVHDLGRATWGNLETLNLQLIQLTLMPWLQKIEQEVSRKLISEPFYVEHLTDALLRGTTMDRYAAYAIGKQNGFLTENEIRQRENLPPIEIKPESEVVSVAPVNDSQSTDSIQQQN